MTRIPAMSVGEMLKWYARFREAYSKYCTRAVLDEPFSPNEMNVLIFLSNNPEINTAKELTVTLGVSKGLVCRSVDSLTRKGYLRSEADKKDHRILHLMPTAKAGPVITRMRISMEQFSHAVTRNIPPEELEIYSRVSEKIVENINQMAKMKEEEHETQE